MTAPRRRWFRFSLRRMVAGRKPNRQPWFIVTGTAFGAGFGLLSVWSGPLNASPAGPIVICAFAGLAVGVLLDLAAYRR